MANGAEEILGFGNFLCVFLSVLGSKIINLLVSRWDFQIRVLAVSLATLTFFHLSVGSYRHHF